MSTTEFWHGAQVTLDQRTYTGYVGAGRSGVEHTWHGSVATESGQSLVGIRVRGKQVAAAGAVACAGRDGGLVYAVVHQRFMC